MKRTPLKRGKALRARSFTERFDGTGDRYGPLFDRVRMMECFGLRYLSAHECGLGYAGATAHHLGKLDRDGLLPVCGKLHDRCETDEAGVEFELAQMGSPTLEELGRMYVGRAEDVGCLDLDW